MLKATQKLTNQRAVNKWEIRSKSGVKKQPLFNP